MGKREVDAKASPEAVNIILLDEIAGKLGVMLERQMEAEQGGMLHPMTLAVTNVLQEWICSPHWYSVTVINDGPVNPVYIDVNREANAVNLGTPLNLAENVVINYNKPKIERIYLRCLPAQTAAVRLFATW